MSNSTLVAIIVAVVLVIVIVVLMVYFGRRRKINVNRAHAAELRGKAHEGELGASEREAKAARAGADA